MNRFERKMLKRRRALCKEYPLLFARVVDDYLQLNKLKKATKIAVQGVGTYPDYLPGNWMLATCWSFQGKLREATQLVTAVLQRWGFDRHGMAMLADLYEQQGDKDAALKIWCDLFRNDPFDKTIERKLEIAISDYIDKVPPEQANYLREKVGDGFLLLATAEAVAGGFDPVGRIEALTIAIERIAKNKPPKPIEAGDAVTANETEDEPEPSAEPVVETPPEPVEQTEAGNRPKLTLRTVRTPSGAIATRPLVPSDEPPSKSPFEESDDTGIRTSVGFFTARPKRELQPPAQRNPDAAKATVIHPQPTLPPSITATTIESSGIRTTALPRDPSAAPIPAPAPRPVVIAPAPVETHPEEEDVLLPEPVKVVQVIPDLPVAPPPPPPVMPVVPATRSEHSTRTGMKATAPLPDTKIESNLASELIGLPDEKKSPAPPSLIRPRVVLTETPPAEELVEAASALELPVLPESLASEMPDSALEEAESPAKSKRKAKPLVSRTIAELYAQQGEYSRAADVYRELIKSHPNRNEYAARLTEMEKLAESQQPRKPDEE